MARSGDQFREAILDLLQELRWDSPTILEDYLRNHLTREGALVYGLEHCVFAANFPRWLANITGNTQTGVVGVLLILSVLVPNLIQSLRERWQRRALSEAATTPLKETS